VGILATSRSSVRIACDCGESFAVSVIRVINLSSDPELLDELLNGELNQVRCNHCGSQYPSETPIFINDSREARYFCVFPSAWRSRELALRVEFYQELLGFNKEAIPGYVREAKFVFGLAPLANLFGKKFPLSESASPALTIVDKTKSILPIEPLTHELEEADFEQVIDVDRIDRRDSALIQRWRESGQDYYAFLDDGALHIFQRHAAPDRIGERADVFFQLHRNENFPLIVLLLVAESVEGGNEVLYWLFNMDNRIDVKFMEQLAENFEVNLHLFDVKYVRQRSIVFSPPLNKNVEYVLAQARLWLEQISPKRRNFFIAASKFDETAYDKLGHNRSGLQPEAFKDLPTPSLTKLALDILTYWSSKENYEYLIFIKSFQVATFKSILHDVLKRSIEFGLAMTKKMQRITVEMGLADTTQDLVSLLLSNFVEVMIGIKENDMDPAAQWDNWLQLVEDANEQGVLVDPEFSELALSAKRKLDDGQQLIHLDLTDDVEMFGALDQLQLPELVDLLKDPENRAEAAKAIAESGRQELFNEVIKAYRRMTRKEVDQLGDSLAGFGDLARDFLRDSAQSGSGTQAIGALRALVRLDGPAVAPFLLEAVISGKRGIWREAAGLMTCLTELPLEPVVEASKHPQAAVRSRVLLLLSDSPDPLAKARLTEMAENDQDSRVRRSARLALGGN
jgi:CpXC motif protein